MGGGVVGLGAGGLVGLDAGGYAPARQGVVEMSFVTYEELFQFCMVLISLTTLIVMIVKKK